MNSARSATAWFAGSVQGVVVQMTTSAGAVPSSAASRPRRRARSALSTTRKPTSIAGEAPVHRLHALIKVAVLDDAAEGAQLLRLVGGRHGEVGPVPVTEDAQALEVGALQLDLLLRVGAARGAEGARIELRARAAMLLLDLQLDRQPVAVPARDVGGVITIE